ncbi:MAG: hypothetical protein LBD68_11275 [Zoogloeaceae bacterium]|nr:hypothetical protein [Zoogloeaceae bacterium]
MTLENTNARLRVRQLLEEMAERAESLPWYIEEMDRRWQRLTEKQRRWFSRLAGVPEAAEMAYSALTKLQRARLRESLRGLARMVSNLEEIFKLDR